MAKWTDYTTDTNPTDTDEVMTLDADKSPKANKRVTLSTLADYFLDKLASKVFAKLDTQNKTVIGALNELNSNRPVIETANVLIDTTSDKNAYSLGVNADEYMIISIQPIDRYGWEYSLTRGIKANESQNLWAVIFKTNPTGRFNFRISLLKIK